MAECADAFAANVFLLDYIQRFSLGEGSKDQREKIESIVDTLRQFCDGGAAVLCAAAVSRQKGKNGSSYGGLNLASFRGSSELEFGCDSAYLLVRGAEESPERVAFQCEKNRHGETVSFETIFSKRTQEFSAVPGLSSFERFDAAKPKPTR